MILAINILILKHIQKVARTKIIQNQKVAQQAIRIIEKALQQSKIILNLLKLILNQIRPIIAQKEIHLIRNHDLIQVVAAQTETHDRAIAHRAKVQIKNHTVLRVVVQVQAVPTILHLQEVAQVQAALAIRPQKVAQVVHLQEAAVHLHVLHQVQAEVVDNFVVNRSLKSH